MKLFLLRRKKSDYDEYDACVVRAENEESAREAAQEFGHGGSQDQLDFADPDASTCEEIPLEGKQEGILGSFCAG